MSCRIVVELCNCMLISLDLVLEQAVQRVWFVRCRSIVLKQATCTNHTPPTLPMEHSKSSEISSKNYAVAKQPVTGCLIKNRH